MLNPMHPVVNQYESVRKDFSRLSQENILKIKNLPHIPSYKINEARAEFKLAVQKFNGIIQNTQNALDIGKKHLTDAESTCLQLVLSQDAAHTSKMLTALDHLGNGNPEPLFAMPEMPSKDAICIAADEL